MKLFLNFLEYVKPYWYKVVFAILLSFLVSWMGAIPAKTAGTVINLLAGIRHVSNPAVMQSKLINACFIMLGAAIIKMLAGTWRAWLDGSVSQRVIFDIRNHIVRHLQTLSLNYFETNQTGQIMSRVTNDVDQVEAMVSAGTIDLSADLINVAIYGSILFVMNWKLALISLITLPAFTFVFIRFARRARMLSREIQKRMAMIYADLQEMISGIMVVQSFVRHKHEIFRFHRKNRETLKMSYQRVRLSSVWHPMAESIQNFGTAGVLLFGGLMVVHGKLHPGDLVTFWMLLSLLYWPVVRLVMLTDTLQRGMGAADRIFELIHLKPDVPDKSDAEKIGRVKGEVIFKNVSFGYEPGREILKNLNFCVKSGESIALVGPSGAGKSTLVNLISRFYDITSGAICIDGHDIRDITQASLRSNIGMVLQDTFLFSGSVRDNLLYGRLTASEEELKDAAHAANADGFIEALPEKYDTEIGERGVKLSGGEKQRLAIARAILKDPPILILDEATSSLDSESEAQIQEALDRLMKNRTSFVIAHRLSTIQNADRILVIDHGEIVETGNHETLLAKGGLYKKLYEMQFRDLFDGTITFTPKTGSETIKNEEEFPDEREFLVEES